MLDWVSSLIVLVSTIIAGPIPTPISAPTVQEAPAQIEYANWMEALLPSVDPNHYGNWNFYRNGGWGASDGVNIYIDPDSPSDLHYSIMVHEYAHLLQKRAYGSIWNSPDTEHEADCIALELGATWLDYSCPDSLRAGAAEIVHSFG